MTLIQLPKEIANGRMTAFCPIPVPHPQPGLSESDGCHGDQSRACIAVTSPRQGAINGDDTVMSLTVLCSAANSPTNQSAPAPGPKPSSAGPKSEPFRFVTDKTKQQKPKLDRAAPRPCAWSGCGQMFVPRKTGRIGEYCCGYCRGRAWQERQEVQY